MNSLQIANRYFKSAQPVVAADTLRSAFGLACVPLNSAVGRGEEGEIRDDEHTVERGAALLRLLSNFVVDTTAQARA